MTRMMLSLLYAAVLTVVSWCAAPAEAQVPPSNDICEGAVDLSAVSLPYHAVVDTRAAQNDISVPQCEEPGEDATVQRGVWYTITPQFTGALQIRADPDLGLFAGIYVGGCEILFPEPASGCAAYLYNTTLHAGVQYHILIGQGIGAPIPTGPIAFDLNFPPPPPNDHCFGAVDLGAAPFPQTHIVEAASAENDIDLPCDGDGRPTSAFGVWYRFTPAHSGVLLMNRNRIPESETELVFAAFTGDCLAGLTPIAGHSCSTNDDHPRTGFELVAGVPHYVLVARHGFYRDPVPPPRRLYQVVFDFPPVPANDECAGAVDLNAIGFPYTAGTPYTETVPNVSATDDIDLGPCDPYSGFSRKGVWYRFTPPTAGLLEMRDTGDQDVAFGVFTGACGALSPLPGGCQTLDTAGAVPVAAGVTYYVLVAHGDPDPLAEIGALLKPSFAFRSQAINETACQALDATPMPLWSVVTPGSGDDPDVACNAPGQSGTRSGVWYRIDAEAPGVLRVAEYSPNDIVFGLFIGPACDALMPVGCSATDTGASFTLPAAGSYWLLVGLQQVTGTPTDPYAVSVDLQLETGACCAGGTCAVRTAAGCAAAGGSFGGVGTICQPAGAPRTYAAGAGSPLAVPDPARGVPQAVTGVLTVPDSFRVASVAVEVTLQHGSAGDLILRLSKGGRSIDLTNSNGGSSDLHGAYVFRDNAAAPLGAVIGVAIVQGSYRASTFGNTPLHLDAVFGGVDSAGEWTLTAADDGVGVTGQISSWRLTLDPASPNACAPACRADFDNQNGVQVADIFAFLRAWFANSPSADFDQQNGIQVADIFAFLRAWFAGC